MYPINPKTAIWLPHGNILIQFEKNSIVFIQADNQHSDVFTLDEDNRKILNTEKDYAKVHFIRTNVSIGLGELEAFLAEDNFCRVNKSFLVNIGYMHSTSKESGGSVFLFNGIEYHLSDISRTKFIQMSDCNNAHQITAIETVRKTTHYPAGASAMSLS